MLIQARMSLLSAGTERCAPRLSSLVVSSANQRSTRFIHELDVGELDLFRDEDIDYATRLLRAGVPTELHVAPGAYHAAEMIALGSALAGRMHGWRLDALRRALGVAAVIPVV